jgi:hypothetical protein
MRPPIYSRKPHSNHELRQATEPIAHHLPTDTRQNEYDADINAITNAWPHLPEAIRAGILAIIRTARGDSNRPN